MFIIILIIQAKANSFLSPNKNEELPHRNSQYLENPEVRCRPKCHPRAICRRRNNCTCPPTYIGDGIHRCVHPAPVIIGDFHLSETSNGSFFFFTIAAVEDWSPTEIFCRFGPTVVKGAFANRTEVFCVPPPIKSGTFSCGLSFDADEWSATLLLIEFRNDRITVHSFVAVFTVGLLALILLTLQWMISKCGKRATERGYEEVMPLNKWHIHQVQPDGSDENTVLNFLLHIIVN
jgi:hypothetical protein